jgi:chaperonin GroES
MALRARPIHDRIIVRREEAKTVTEGGIHLVERARTPQRCGEVLASGPGYTDEKGKFIPNTLKAGDRILFGAYAGTELKLDGETYQVMRESDVAGLLDADTEMGTNGLTGVSAHRGDVHEYYQ